MEFRLLSTDVVEYMFMMFLNAFDAMVAQNVCKLWHGLLRRERVAKAIVGRTRRLRVSVFENAVAANVFENAARHGYVDLLEWAYGALVNKDVSAHTYGIAAGHGNLRVLDWLYNNAEPKFDCTFDRMICTAAQAGRTAPLKWVVAHGGVITHDIYRFAAKHQQLRVMVWAHANGVELPAVRRGLWRAAFDSGSIEIFMWVWYACGKPTADEYFSLRVRCTPTPGTKEIMRWLQACCPYEHFAGM